MQAFPLEYTTHNLPLVVLSGLGEQRNDAARPAEPGLRDNGVQIRLGSKTCAGECVPQLLDQLLQFDGSNQPWNSSSLPGPSGRMMFKIMTAGRTYALPPRKAAPLAQPTSSDSFQNNSSSPPRSTELHSPLSPLSPGSPAYPDGVFTPVWLAKHQQHVPAMIIGFFDLNVSANGHQDAQIKADINSVRAALTRSGYRTKFAAVLVSDRSILQDPGLEERISSIRRATGLDSKLGLFFMPPMSSQVEVSTFVEVMMKALQPLCVEVYRDLTKHARRKKARVGPNPNASSPTGTVTQALSVSGWNVRYEIKQGVFAEYRQEMDVAERHYLLAIDELFGDEGVLESMPTWSPRWNEARLLSDCLALRVVRSQLWSNSTVSAAQYFTRYKSRVKSVVDRRGKGSRTYSWAAWEARWAEVMAQLIIRAEVPAFQEPQRHSNDTDEHPSWQIYSVTEKNMNSIERLPPCHNLHHPGYWLRLAARNARIRRQRALDIPEEDRSPPGQSPASTVFKRTKSYDFYLAPEPHEESPLSASSSHDHIAEYADLTKQAIDQFDKRSQARMGAVLRLDHARDLVAAEKYGEAVEALRPLLDKLALRDEWSTDMLLHVLNLVRECARHTSASDLLIATTYELLSLGSTTKESISLAKAVNVPTQPPTILHFFDRQRLCPVNFSFSFESTDTSVGETFGCQLLVQSCLNANVEPVEFSSITLLFDNNYSICIRHDASQDSSFLTFDADLDKEVPESQADLTMRPGDRRILNFSLTFKEAQTVRLAEMILAIETDAFNITHAITDQTLFQSNALLGLTEHGLMRKDAAGGESTVIAVAPKPPKVQILVQGQKKQSYTDETIRLSIVITNGEDEAIDGSITSRVQDEDESSMNLSWEGDDNSNVESAHPNNSAVKSIQHLEPSASQTLELLIKAPPDPLKAKIEIFAEYTVISKSSANIRKSTVLDLDFTAPFGFSSSFGPMLYADPWPNYFDPARGPSNESPEGIPQLWRLNTQLRSIASETLVLHGAELKIHGVSGESLARVRSHEHDDKSRSIEPRQHREYLFDLHTQKHSLDDRRPTSIESILEVTWSRDGESNNTTTRLPLPRLTLPVSEPRVLCTRDDGPTDDGCTIGYHIENPSTHFLTFALSMEASEDFAFSGPKYQSLSLAPLSRHRVEYQVLLQGGDDNGDQWVWPSMQVVDSYYQKTLRVLPGGPHVKLDEMQNIGVRIGRTST